MAYLSPSVLTIIFTFMIMGSVWAILYLAYAYNKEQSDKNKVKKDVPNIELNDNDNGDTADEKRAIANISKSLRRIEITVSAFIAFLIIFILTKF
ncbi:MAG: hypothetical protein ACFNLN_00095 [Treponema socranskii subsp. buccale]|jgi:hypothetical protein